MKKLILLIVFVALNGVGAKALLRRMAHQIQRQVGIQNLGQRQSDAIRSTQPQRGNICKSDFRQ